MRSRIKPAVVGATWGLGHGLGVALLGVLGQTLLSMAQVEVASVWAERLVGLVLIVLGVVAIRRGRTIQLHEHTHEHDGEAHTHLHMHEHEGRHGSDQTDASKGHGVEGHRHGQAAFGIGVVHGLAGAGHFWAVLPSLAMQPAEAAIYIGGYLGASVAAMVLFGWILGLTAERIGVRWVPNFIAGVGALTIAIGVWWTSAAFGWL